MKITLSDNLLFKLLLLTPLTMQIQRILDAANRLSVGVFLLLMLILILKKCTISDCLLVIVYSSMFIVSCMNINPDYFYSNLLFFFPLWYLYLVYSGRRFNQFIVQGVKRNLNFIKYVIIIWCLSVIISIPFSSSYVDFQFRSFTQGPFRLAPTALMIAILIWIYACEKGNKLFLLLIIIPFLAIAFSGCRSYTIVMLTFLFYVYYGFCNNKIYFLISIVPVIIGVVFGLSKTSFFTKFDVALNNPYVTNKLTALTSGRSMMWEYALWDFGNANWFVKLFGGGITHSYEIFYEMNGSVIWAHNDFFEMLICHGIVGLFLYNFVFIRFVCCVNKKNRLTTFQFLIFIAVNLINASINGLYVYNTALLSIPLLWYGLAYDFKYVNKQ